MQGHFDYKDIQAIIFSGYGKLRLARYVFLRIDEPEKARTWLRWLEGEVTTAAELRRHQKQELKKPWAVNIAFTAEGLKALGFSAEELSDSFPAEFVEGMANEARSRILGDTGWSAPRFWEFGGDGERAPTWRDLHVVLMLFSEGTRRDDDLESDWRPMEALHERQRGQYEAHGLKALFVQDVHLMGSKEEGFRDPFGFKGGISQPVIEGYSAPSTQGPTIEPGEVILGYENAHGRIPPSPTVPDDWDTRNHLPRVPGSSRKDLGCNGSYLVIRKLWQNVKAFEAFLDAHGGADRELLAAKLMGRWRSGAPLSLCPEQDDPRLGADSTRNNCFAYAQDPQGMLCPVGSHIRRSNPRDALIPGKRQDSLEVVARHQIIRRGRPYHDEGLDEQGREKQGMFFVALNANIRGQFEFIQHAWLNSTKFGGHYDSKDPLLGDNPDAVPPPPKPGEHPAKPEPCSVTLPGFPVSRRIEGLTRFVEVRGGGYFFLPGIKALRFLGALSTPVRTEARPAAPQRLSATLSLNLAGP